MHRSFCAFSWGRADLLHFGFRGFGVFPWASSEKLTKRPSFANLGGWGVRVRIRRRICGQIYTPTPAPLKIPAQRTGGCIKFLPRGGFKKIYTPPHPPWKMPSGQKMGWKGGGVYNISLECKDQIGTWQFGSQTPHCNDLPLTISPRPLGQDLGSMP